MLKTRLTDRLEIDHPILLAPMNLASGGRLVSAVSTAGGLGFIGGGYGDADWLKQELAQTGNQRFGCGFITWSLAERPELLDLALDHAPEAIFLSFGDPAPFAAKILDAGVRLFCQIQTLRDARHAIGVGADVIIAQGAEAGGHGERRATMTLVPEVADMIAKEAPDILLCAAGGIGDGRGLAAALMLGADGVLIGSRFWASSEALVHPDMHTAALAATGDQTIRSTVMDVARNLNWPDRYNCRVLQNDFTDRWHDELAALKAVAPAEAERWRRAWIDGDTSTANTFVGEVTGLIQDIRPAADILAQIVAEAEVLLGSASKYTQGSE